MLCMYIARRRHYIHLEPRASETRAVFRDVSETLLCRVSFALFTHVVASLIKMHTFTYVRYAYISTSPSTVSERGARETNLCSCGIEARDLTLCHL